MDAPRVSTASSSSSSSSSFISTAVNMGLESLKQMGAPRPTPQHSSSSTSSASAPLDTKTRIQQGNGSFEAVEVPVSSPPPPPEPSAPLPPRPEGISANAISVQVLLKKGYRGGVTWVERTSERVARPGSHVTTSVMVSKAILQTHGTEQELFKVRVAFGASYLASPPS